MEMILSEVTSSQTACAGLPGSILLVGGDPAGAHARQQGALKRMQTLWILMVTIM